MEDRAVERTQQWRQEMRANGYALTHVWLKITDKRLIQDKARQRHQSLADCIMDGIKALPPVTRQTGPSTTELATRLARLEQQFSGQTTSTVHPVHPLSQSFVDPRSGQLTATAPLPDWVVCKNQRHWKALKGECAICKKEREQRKKKPKKTDISLELSSIPDTDVLSSTEVPIGTFDNPTTEGL